MKTGFACLLMLIIAGGLPAQEKHTQDSLDSVKKALAERKAVLIDVREKSEWDDGHLAGASLLSMSTLKQSASSKEVKELLPKDKPIYLHCAAGGRCLKAAEILRKEGYDVRALKEGYKDLLTNGFKKAEK